MSKKSDQIEWLVNWANEEKEKDGELWRGLDAHNLDMMGEFEDANIKGISWSLWKSRVRDAAKVLGLNGTRMYNYDGGGGYIPRYTVTYLRNKST